MLKKIQRYLRSPYYAFGCDLMKNHPNWMSDEYYIKVLWKQMMHYPLDLKHPKTYNEKLQWLKLYNRDPLYTQLADKYKVKEWVKNRIGEEYVIPLLAKYSSPDEIDFDLLPNQFVLKCNHDSGSVIVVKDKHLLNKEETRNKLKESLDCNFYYNFREWVYKDIEPCIIAEKYVEDIASENLFDYKFFCFDGIPKILYVAHDGAKKPTTDFFDMEFNHLPIRMKDPNSTEIIVKPKTYEKMKELACVLSEGITHVRVDFYSMADTIYFGEMTFYPSCGFTEVKPYEWNLKMGDWIQLPEKRC